MDKYKVQTSELVEWVADSGLVVADQWTSIPKRHNIMQKMAHLSLLAQPLPLSRKAMKPFEIFGSGTHLGRLIEEGHLLQCCKYQKDILL